LNPNESRAHYELGRASLRARRWDRALAAFQEASRLSPNNITYHCEVAWILATCPETELRDIPQAVERARTAAKILPNSHSGWRALGVARYRAGDTEGAIAALEQSSRLYHGGSSYEWFFLAMAHWQRGEPEQARRFYGRAVGWMKGKTWVEDNPSTKEELDRFRAEAAKLLGIDDAPLKKP
jgi:tetratricopeptide (TPR) repeat protein